MQKISIKNDIATFSIISFLIAFAGYYLFFVFVQKNSNKFCSTHYCLDLLTTGEFLSTIIAIIGLVAVVKSLDLWKEGQRYLERRELVFNTRSNLQNIKERFFKNFVFDANYDHLEFISLAGISANSIEHLKTINIDSEKIKNYESYRDKVLKLVSLQVINLTQASDIDIGRECSFLLESINQCIQELDEVIKRESL